jgi:hypothetical protein
MPTHAEAVQAYDNGYYKNKLEEGLVFQDVVTRILYQRGIVIVGYASRRFQNSHGENMLGAEIKRDGKFRKTKNLYLEIAEKSHPNNAFWVNSGIKRNDNGWLYVIGDEKTIWIFVTKLLRDKRTEWERVNTPTSVGYLMPLAAADEYCIRRIDLKGG